MKREKVVEMILVSMENLREDFSPLDPLKCANGPNKSLEYYKTRNDFGLISNHQYILH